MYRTILIALVAVSCSNVTKPDFEKERTVILKLQDDQREYHFRKNARAMVDIHSDEFISIDRGKVSFPQPEQTFKMFDRYFKSVEFVKWDDIQEPIIRFSDDASVAYVAVQKEVILKAIAADGKEAMDTTRYAWLSVYKKVDDAWKLDCITSTNM
jgi:hypothetical protein